MSFKLKAEELQMRLDALWPVLRIDEQREQLKVLEVKMSSPDFWSDQEKAKTVSQEAADISSEVTAWETMRDDLRDAKSLFDLADLEQDEGMMKQAEEELDVLSKAFNRMEIAVFFDQPYDKNNAIVTVHAGAGGTDAMDWAEMLFRMYVRFIEQQGWKIEMLHESLGEEAGYKHATFLVKGRYVYGHLRNEAGVHRLVRISPFDAEKMRHTAFALVEVLPELDEMTEKNIVINPEDVRIDTFMAGGKGGQSVNTTYSAVRLTHIPTNIVVSCQNERSQLQNRETAFRILKSRLFQRMQEERAEAVDQLKGGHKSAEWGAQIRSYVLHPYKMVKDHRTLHETQDTDAVLAGDVLPFIEAQLRAQKG